MDIRFLQTLLHVVNGGSLAEAARRQNLTPAAVGQRLKALEAELGVALVRRSGPTVLPTEDCQRILPRLRTIMSETALLTRDIANDDLVGPYRLGAISTALADYVPPLLTDLQSRAPKLDLTVIPGASSGLFQMLSDGDLDAAILVEPSFQIRKSLAITPLAKQPFAWVYPTNKAPDDLPLIGYDKASWGGKIAWRWIEQTVRPIDMLCEMDALETVAALVAGGAGRTILPVWDGLSKVTGIEIQVIDEIPKRSVVFAHRAMAIDSVCADLLVNPGELNRR